MCLQVHLAALGLQRADVVIVGQQAARSKGEPKLDGLIARVLKRDVDPDGFGDLELRLLRPDGDADIIPELRDAADLADRRGARHIQGSALRLLDARVVHAHELAHVRSEHLLKLLRECEHAAVPVEQLDLPASRADDAAGVAVVARGGGIPSHGGGEQEEGEKPQQEVVGHARLQSGTLSEGWRPASRH